MLASLLLHLLATPVQETRFESEIAAFEEADHNHSPKPGGVVFVGSSSIRLWKTLAEDFPGQNVINRGFGGSYLSESVMVAHRIVTPYKPKLIVLFAGTNDIADGKSAQTVLDDYRSFVGVVRKELPNVKIAYISITPAPSRWSNLATIQEANRLIQEEAKKDKGQRFVDMQPLFITDKGGPRPELFVEDQLHLNAEGYQVWTTQLRPVLHEMAGGHNRAR